MQGGTSINKLSPLAPAICSFVHLSIFGTEFLHMYSFFVDILFSPPSHRRVFSKKWTNGQMDGLSPYISVHSFICSFVLVYLLVCSFVGMQLKGVAHLKATPLLFARKQQEICSKMFQQNRNNLAGMFGRSETCSFEFRRLSGFGRMSFWPVKNLPKVIDWDTPLHR